MKTAYITPQAKYTPDGIYEFTKKVNIESSETYKINIFTSGRYILHINGKYICEGPCKGHEYVRYYDTVETDAFRPGENEIKITVMHIFYKKRFTTVFKQEKPEVIFEATSAANKIESDTSWQCQKNGQLEFNYMKWRFIPPYEIVDFTKNEFENYSLENKGGFDFAKGIETFCGIASGTLLTKRPIPMFFPGDNIDFKVIKTGDGFVELDAGEYMTAKVYFEFTSAVNAKIIYSECYTVDDCKKLRDDVNGVLNGYYDTVISDHAASYSPFWFRCFRFIRIEAENIDKLLGSVKARRWNYPVDLQGSFECSDDYYNRMQKVSINTMLCCTHDTFYDCPYYEQQQYEMDSAVEAAVLMRMTGDWRMVKKCIEDFAASQQDSGVLLSIYPSIVKQIIPGYSLFWIFMLKDYLDCSKDIHFTGKFIGNMDKIISYFESRLSPEGLVTRSRYWDFVDWVDEWDNGEPVTEEGKPITIYSMYFAYALLCAENICKKIGRCGLASEYRSKYDAVCAAIKKHCYDNEKDLYTDSTYPSAYSVHTIIWAVISELENGDRAAEFMGRINEDGLARSSFSMNYYLFRALEKCGRTNDIFSNLHGWVKMLDNHCTSWCESPNAGVRSECHGWSSAPLYEFSSNILGVKTGFEDEIIIKPHIAGLSYAKGNVPTRFGNVVVSWTNDNDFKITVDAPSGVAKTLILPNGETKHFDKTVSHVEC